MSKNSKRWHVAKASIGIIGGSGLYRIEGIKVIEEVTVKTPWGYPSDSLVIAEIGGVSTAFLPRHGKGHVFLPHEINFRANIAALKMVGVEKIVAFSAVGSLKEEIRPLDFVLPSQVIDRTRGRESTFFGGGIAAHVGFADPFCGSLCGIIASAAAEEGLKLHTGETLICMEGPAFSSRAESMLYRSWGAGVINMSTLPEAKLAREAEMCYAVMAHVTDYDVWHESEEDVTVELVLQTLSANVRLAQRALLAVVERLAGSARPCECEGALANALITAREAVPPETLARLRPIVGKYFGE